MWVSEWELYEIVKEPRGHCSWKKKKRTTLIEQGVRFLTAFTFFTQKFRATMKQKNLSQVKIFSQDRSKTYKRKGLYSKRPFNVWIVCFFTYTNSAFMLLAWKCINWYYLFVLTKTGAYVTVSVGNVDFWTVYKEKWLYENSFYEWNLLCLRKLTFLFLLLRMVLRKNMTNWFNN